MKPPIPPAPGPAPSTPVNTGGKAEATRARLLEAARILFSQNSYDAVGVREIALQAQADPALVMRYFGSKLGLFEAVAAQAFDPAPLLDDGAAGLAGHAAAMLLGPLDRAAWRHGYDPLRLVLCSIGSPTAGPIVGRYLQQDFVSPLSASLSGPHSEARATLLTAQIVGMALIRIALPDTTRSQTDPLPDLLQQCLRVAAQGQA